MSRVIVLDSGPLGLLCEPAQKAGLSNDCKQWLSRMLSAGARVVIPEIADFEIRRELIRADLTNSIDRLDTLNATLEYLPISTDSMRQAAKFWALARQAGTPTASDKTIDADMILAAQTVVLNESVEMGRYSSVALSVS